MTNHKVYRIIDENGMAYIGSTGLKMCQRRGNHHRDFKTLQNRRLYDHWRSVGWDAMRFEIIQENIESKERRKQIEQENILNVPKEKRLNIFKAFCPDYQSTKYQ